MRSIQLVFVALVLGWAGVASAAQTPPEMKMSTPIPPSITTPDKVETSIGTLRFTDGLPDDATVQKVYDNLDRQRGVEVFLNTMPGASINAIREGLRGQGVDNQTLVIFEDLMDSKSLFLTPNTETVYLLGWLDLKDGPMVVETSPDILGIVDDHWFRYVADLGNAGPDKGKGGKYLFVPPGYKGEIPEGYFVYHTPTYGNWLVGRGFLVNGDPKHAVESFKKTWRQYPLAKAANPPETKFINVSGVNFNTVHPNTFQFYEDVNTIVQEEPSESQEPELLGQLMAIGIEKGYFQQNDLHAYSLNNLTAKPNSDGSYTIRFGGCTKSTENCLPIMKGWNYAVRMYEPSKAIIDGSWTFPGPPKPRG